jgi:hypothetical protein
MATSPNFNWPEPDNTDLVKNGALAIRTAVNAIDTSLVDLKGGTTGQVLAKATNTDMDFTWTSAASGGGMTVLASGTLSSTALDLTSIDQTYTNLVLEITDANWGTSNDYLKMRFNNLSTSIYTSVAQGTNDRGGASSFYGAGNVDRFIIWGGVTLLRTGKNSILLTIPNYTQTKGRRNMFGTIIAENGTPSDTVVYWNGYSTDTAAISRITFSTQDGYTFSSGSYKLWGVK